MDISAVHDDGTEVEFEINICCVSCAQSYGWSADQFDKIYKKIQAGQLQVPASIKSNDDFIRFVKNS